MARHLFSTRTMVFVALTCLFALLGAATSAHSPQAVAAPTLKWQYGGCSSASCQTGWYASPAVADLDNDGAAEVVWASYDTVALNGANGSLRWRAANTKRAWPSIAVSDLTGDGSLETIVGRDGDQLTVYRADGSTLWTRNPFGGGEIRTLAVEDLEHDGQREIIVGRAGNGRNGERATKQVSVYEADGSVRNGWPARHDGEVGYGANMYNENIAVADLDNDGFKELFAPTDVHYITALDRNGTQLAANPLYGANKVWSQVGVHVDQAADLRGYAECGTEHRPNFANSAPAVADVDGDGTLEFVVVGDVYNCDIGDPEGDLYHLPWILKLDRSRWSGSGFDWTTIPTARPNSGPLSQDYDLIQNSVTNAVVADLDGDGKKEIIYPSYDGRLHAFWLDKTEHGNWPFRVPGTGIRFAAEPAIVDLDNDGAAEVIVTSWPENGGGRVGQLHILDSQGNQIHAVDLPAPRGDDWNGGLGAPTVANIDADADLEVVVGTVASGVVAYDLPNTAHARCQWCTGRGGFGRTGVAAPPTNGFTLKAEPSAQAIAPGATATYRIRIAREGTFNSAVTIHATSDSPNIQVEVTPTSVTPPGEVLVTLTDTSSDATAPSRYVTITVTATGGANEHSVTLSLLVGGTHTLLPVVRR